MPLNLAHHFTRKLSTGNNGWFQAEKSRLAVEAVEALRHQVEKEAEEQRRRQEEAEAQAQAREQENREEKERRTEEEKEEETRAGDVGTDPLKVGVGGWRFVGGKERIESEREREPAIGGPEQTGEMLGVYLYTL